MQINLSLTSLLTPSLRKDNIVIHFLVGWFLPSFFDCLGMNHGMSWLWIIGLVIILAWDPFKEFYWDPHHEDVSVSGGWKGDVSDFLEYLVGTGVFLVVKFG